MVLKLYGHPRSPSCILVAQVLVEKDVTFQWVTVDMADKREHKFPEYMAKHPFGQVPLLEDTETGFTLYESRAICRYITERYKHQRAQLIPKSHGLSEEAKAIFEQAAKIGQPPNAEFMKQHLTALEATFDVYEGILSRQRYISGDEISLVDLFHVPYASLLESMLGDGHSIMYTEKRPCVARWFRELEARPAWGAVKNGGVEAFA